MSGAHIFLVGGGKDRLLPMVETAYSNEDVLQTYLERYPDLLPGEQIDPENPRRWLLVAREMSVPGDVDETGRWSLDHLFLDQDGIPTFVECKRSSDTRGRREVVAQMLDYAANGLEYWSISRLRQAAMETASKQGKSIEAEVGKLIDSQDESEIENYWKLVESNLDSSKVRLIFVADETSKELRRLVEFLNAQLRDVEVLAIEIKQFLGENQTALVPRTIGITEASRESKGTSRNVRKTNELEFLSKCPPAAASNFKTILDAAEKHGHTIYWGDSGFSIRAYLPKAGKLCTFVVAFPATQFKFSIDSLPLSEGEEADLRQKLKSWGFVEAGIGKMKIALDEKSADQAQEAYRFMLAFVDGLVKAN